MKVLRVVGTSVLFLFLQWGCSSQQFHSSPERYFQKIKSDPIQLRAFLEKFPKGADLHNHLDGAIYAENYIRWASEDAKCIRIEDFTILLPPCHPESGTKPVVDIITNSKLVNGAIDAMSTRNYQYGDRSGHTQFFSSFGRFGAASIGREGDMLAEVTRRAARQNILYLEIIVVFGMFDAAALSPKISDSYTQQDLSDIVGSRELLDIVNKVIELTDKAEERRQSLLGCNTGSSSDGCDVTVRYIPSVLRILPKDQVISQTALAFSLVKQDPRYVGINFVAAEDDLTATKDYESHMSLIRDMTELFPATKNRISLHAGELALGVVPPEDIKNHIQKAINIAGARRIGHGVSIIYEKDYLALLDKMSKQGILVEINLTSNDVILGISGDHHPFNLYRNAKVPLAISTDDEGVARIDLTHEYQRAVETYNLNYPALKSLSRNALEFSFLSGKSLFSEFALFTILESCKDDSPAIQDVSKPCKEFLAENEKARYQWILESRFIDFERDIMTR